MDSKDKQDFSTRTSDNTVSSDSSQSVEEFRLASRETAAVRRSKVLVILALIIAAAAVATLIYMLTSSGEKNDFEGDIATFADEILEVAEAHTRDILGASRTLSTSPSTSESLASTGSRAV